MVKNTCFCIAKQQKIDGSQGFWLVQSGDDHLEKLFGITHMKGQHNSAMNYSQALDRIGTAKDINAVFKRHPDLESGSRQLKLMHVEGLDHIWQDLWVGDVVVSHCDLPSAWKHGHEMALTVLADAHVPALCCTFEIFFSEPGCDLMCPWGANKYLGVALDVELMSTAEPAGVLPPTVNEELELEEDTLTLEEALMHGVPSGNPNIIPIPSSPCTAPALASRPEINADNFLLVNGKYIHKETIC
jgi:hypothetical protein